MMLKMRRLQSLVVLGLLGGASLFVGCASSPPETSDASGKEIKSDSDRAFEKMKQEEQERERARVREGMTNPNPGSTR